MSELLPHRTFALNTIQVNSDGLCIQAISVDRSIAIIIISSILGYTNAIRMNKHETERCRERYQPTTLVASAVFIHRGVCVCVDTPVLAACSVVYLFNFLLSLHLHFALCPLSVRVYDEYICIAYDGESHGKIQYRIHVVGRIVTHSNRC